MDSYNVLKEAVKKCSDERGSVEASLVLIPSVILFLVVLQLSLSVYQRNQVLLTSQEVATTIAREGLSESQNCALSEKSLQVNISRMPSGRALVMTHALPDRIRDSLVILNFIGHVPLSVFGYAVSENDR